MKSYKSEIDIREAIFKVNVKLSQVEVKGDSVELLLASRFMLKELFEKIEETEDVENGI